MCFSAETSFTSAALLAGITYAAALQAKNKRQYPLLIIPFIFTLMQIVEGFSWLASEHGFFPAFFLPFGSYFFLFISHFYLLLVSPFVFYFAEGNPKRKKILGGILLASCILVLAILYLEITAPAPPSLKIVKHSIQYTFTTFEPYPFLEQIKGYILLLLLVGPTFISTMPGRWPVAIVIAATFFIALYFYNYAFTSVWCFFAAVVSALILVILHRMNKQI